MNVAQKQKLRIAILRRNTWLKFFKYVQLGEISFCLVQVVQILAAPTKCFACGALDSAGVHAMLAENRLVLGGEVITDDRHQSHWREIAGGQRKIGGRPTQNVLGASRWGRDAVEGN